MSKVFLTSDLHLYHKRVIQFADRPFKDLREMHFTLVENWNSVVGKKDKVYVLGDVSFNNKPNTKKIIERLRGYKILIMGNHDKRRSRKWWLDVGFDEVIKHPIIYNQFLIFSHEPVYCSNFVNFHGHLHDNNAPEKVYNYHVNVNVEFNNYTPVCLDNYQTLQTYTQGLIQQALYGDS